MCRKRSWTDFRHPTFQEAYDIEANSLRNLISPKYSEFEIDAMATARAYVRSKMHMNFNQTFEGAFVMGAKWAIKPKEPSEELK